MKPEDLKYFDGNFKTLHNYLKIIYNEKSANLTQQIIEDVTRKIFIRVNCDIIFTIEMYALLKGCDKDQADKEVNEFLNL